MLLFSLPIYLETRSGITEYRSCACHWQPRHVRTFTILHNYPLLTIFLQHTTTTVQVREYNVLSLKPHTFKRLFCARDKYDVCLITSNKWSSTTKRQVALLILMRSRSLMLRGCSFRACEFIAPTWLQVIIPSLDACIGNFDSRVYALAG